MKLFNIFNKKLYNFNRKTCQDKWIIENCISSQELSSKGYKLVNNPYCKSKFKITFFILINENLKSLI